MLKPRIAILASGGGSTAEAFVRATQEGRVNAEVGLIVCNNMPEKAGIYDRIKRLNGEYGIGIPVVRISGVTHPRDPGGKGEQTLEESEAITAAVWEAECSFVALMGYMKKVRGTLLEAYGWQPWMCSSAQARMINTHPGPLPQTQGLFGIHVQEKVLETGLGYSAHTVHVVSGEYDQGSVLAETRVPVELGDTAATLFERVQQVEKVSLPQIIGHCLLECGLS